MWKCLLFIKIFLFYFSFTCLHYKCELYNPDLTNRTFTERKKCRSAFYYTEGVNKWKKSGSVGYGDFLIYNILVLIALPSSSSLITKICVTFGSIISVQIGSLLTYLLRCLTKKYSAPGVPLPVITVSVYLFILDLIMPNKFNRC
jgi:hypothetical protein